MTNAERSTVPQIFPQLAGYELVSVVAQEDGIPYSSWWIRKLILDNKIKGGKFGVGRRGQWIVHRESLQTYITEMEKLGSSKHDPRGTPPT